jgi:general secretion pathway protein N
MNSPVRQLMVGVLCFLLFVITTIPAGIIRTVVPADIQLIGIEGTLWAGRVRMIQYAGYQLQETEWDLHPFSLLTGRMALTIESKLPGGFARGDVSAGLTGSVSIRDFTAAAPFAPIAQTLQLPPSGGELGVQIPFLDISDGWPSKLIAELRVGNVPLNIFGVAAGPVGSYEATFNLESVPEDGKLTGTLKDLGGPVQLGGNVELLPPGNYALNALVTARADAPTDLASGLELLGPENPDGSRSFQFSGSL